MRVVVPLVIFTLVTMAGAGTAEEVIVDHDAYYDYQAHNYARHARVPLATGPRVYEWAYVRLNCGTFRYWDGTRCADARFQPPRE